MEPKSAEMYGYMAHEIAHCAHRQQELEADQRADEAVFEKIKANVYDIFRTILDVALKSSRGDEAEAARFFRQKLKQLPAAWAAAQDKARQHGDAVLLRLEEVKLDTAAEIERRFDEIWGVAE